MSARISRVLLLVVIVVATGVSVLISSVGFFSLFADDYTGSGLPPLGLVGFPAAFASFAFSIVACTTALRWPLYVAVSAILLGLVPALAQPIPLEIELFVYRRYFIAQAVALFSLTILILLDLKLLRK